MFDALRRYRERRVLRTSATEQNPAVMRLNSELRGLRSELARMESAQAGSPLPPGTDRYAAPGR